MVGFVGVAGMMAVSVFGGAGFLLCLRRLAVRERPYYFYALAMLALCGPVAGVYALIGKVHGLWGL